MVYRVVCKDSDGNNSFLKVRKGCDVSDISALFHPWDGAVTENPSAFEPYETVSVVNANRIADIATNKYTQACVMQWKN